LFGTTVEERMAMTIDMVYPPGEFERIKNNIINPKIEHFYKTGAVPYIHFETQQYRKDGTMM
jgi:hypothetical protein